MLGLASVAGAALLVLAWAGIRAGEALAARLADPVTVAVWGAGLESADAAAARAEEILRQAPGVTAVRVLEPAAGDVDLAELMGAPATGAEEVRLLGVAASGAAAGERAGASLAGHGLAVRIDDHAWPGSPSLRRAAIVGGAAAAALIVLAVAVAAASGLAVRRDMKAHRELVELIRLCGATDRFIGGLFRRRAIGLAFWACIAGAAAGVVAVAAWARFGQGSPLDLVRPLTPLDLAFAIAWLLLALALAAAGSAAACRAVLKTAP